MRKVLQEFISLGFPRAQLSSGGWCYTASRERGFGAATGQPFLQWSETPRPRHDPPAPRYSLSGRKSIVLDKLWREFFSDPSQWWDCRSEKINPKYPDFKHKKTIENALWLIDNANPPWVASELAAMAPGTLQADIFSWNVKLRRYVKAGDYQKTVKLFQQMQHEGMNPDEFSFVAVLNACSGLRALEEGRRIHTQTVQAGCESDVFVGSSLVHMYGKCGSIGDARIVFNKMPTRNVVAWSAMILGYVKCGEAQEALQLSQQMQQEGVEADPVTFVGVLNACASLAALDQGRRVHEQIIKRGYDYDVFVSSSLVDMYAKCGRVEDARTVFNKMRTRNVVAWSAMILGHVKCGEGEEALVLSQQMQRDGVEPNPLTFVGMLNACASVGALEEGRHIHKQIIERGYEYDVFVGNCLVDMYVKSGSIEDAWEVFRKMSTRDVVTWSAMILGYVKCGNGHKALELFQQMERERVDPNPITFAGVLNACSVVVALEEGRRVHKQIIERGYEYDAFVGNCLVDMYTKCGSIEDARRVFNKLSTRDVAAWSAMILGYVKYGQGGKALELSREMLLEGVDPDPCTFVGMLNACASLAALEEGRDVHKQIIEGGYEYDVVVGNCLVNMYAKCGSIEDARRVFDKMSTRDVVAWSAIILGYVKCGQGQEALELSRQMQREGVEPNPVTFVGVLNACASVAALEEGKRVHEQIIERGYDNDVFLGNCLIDMYARCGSIEDGQRVFKNMHTRDVVTWTAMLAGYGKHGYANEACEFFEKMCQENVEVDGVTFISLLSACSHGGLVDEGMRYFKSMSSVYNVSPTVEHYACVVDLLGRAGRLHEAEDLIRSMAWEPDATLWMSLLGTCKVLGDVEMGQRFAKEVMKLDAARSMLLVSEGRIECM